MKETLRGIYRLARNVYDAELMLTHWCRQAEASDVGELRQMARTVRRHFDGILAYWRSDKLTSAQMEGFNTKIRWLIRQAYGYRDDDYFILKIYDLPTINPHPNP